MLLLLLVLVHAPSLPMRLLCLLASAVPVGVGSEGALTLRAAEMDKLLNRGMAYVEELGLSWPEDRLVTEENVRGCWDAAVQVVMLVRRCCQQQLVVLTCCTMKFCPTLYTHSGEATSCQYQCMSCT